MSSRTHSIKKEKPIVFQPHSLAQYFLAGTKVEKIKKITPSEIEKWPREWKEVSFKSYPRMKQVVLPIKNFNPKGISLKTALLKRKSERQFKKKHLTLADLSELLYFSSGIVRNKDKDLNETRRPYPSGGARYPLEIYLAVNRVSKLEHGLYHYDVKKHKLEFLLRGNFAKKLAQDAGQDWVKEAKAVFFISAVFGRTEIKYQSRGLRYIFMEAGHLCQNVYLLAEDLGLACCSIGGYADNKIDNLLDLNGIDESVVYIVTLG